MTKLIDGKKLAEHIKDDIVAEVMNLPARPGLAIILVGDRADSELYVKLKEREGKKVGIDTHLYRFNKLVTTAELIETIGYLNADPAIDGILLQLPLPETLNEDAIVASIKPEKDIDGFHPENLKKIEANDPAAIIPPLANVVLEMLDSIKVPPTDKTVAIIAKSDIFTAGVGDVLRNEGAKIIAIQPDDANIKTTAKTADIVITAVGKKHYLTADYIKEGAIIIDIGIIKEGDKTYGDVNAESITDVASHLSPVPGGVGPLTIAFALKNVLEVYKRKQNEIKGN